MAVAGTPKPALRHPKAVSPTSCLAFLVAACGSGRKGRGPVSSAASTAAAPATATAVAAPAVAAARAAAAARRAARTAIDLTTNRVHAALAPRRAPGRRRRRRSTSSSTSTAAGRPLAAGREGRGASRRRWSRACRRWCSCRSTPTATARAARALGDATLSITMRALAPQQRVSVFVNEKPVGTLEVDDGHASATTSPSRRRCCTPATTACGCTFKSAADVAGRQARRRRGDGASRSVRRALGPPAAPTSRRSPARDVDLGGARRRALVAGRHGLAAVVLRAAPGGRAAGRRRTAPPSRGRHGAGARRRRRPADAHAARGQRRRRAGPTRSVDLGAAAGQAARIDLDRARRRRSPGPSRASSSRRRAGRRAPTPAARSFDHIFVWMVDTLRADKVRAYNPKTRVLTPNYDAFAADATRFAWAQVPGTWSLPSHASLLTGVYPTVHRATAHEARLSKDVPFVAEEHEEGRLQDRRCSRRTATSRRSGASIAAGTSTATSSANRSPNGAEYLWKTAKAWMTPDRRQARSSSTSRPSSRTSPTRRKQGVPGQVLGQGLHRADQAGAVGRAARPHQGRQAQGQRQRQGVPRGAARRRDHRRATPRSRPSSPTSRRWASTTSRR